MRRSDGLFNRSRLPSRPGGTRFTPFLELLKAEESPGDLTVKGDLVAQHEFMRAGVIGGIAQSHDGAEWIGVGGHQRGGYVIVESDFLHSPDPLLTPTGCRYGVHKHSFGGRLGLVLFEQFFQKFKECVFLFGFQHNGFGQETVADAIAGGVAFPLGCDWPF